MPSNEAKETVTVVENRDRDRDRPPTNPVPAPVPAPVPVPVEQEEEEEGHVKDISDIPDHIVDNATFGQILEMDDDEEREFSTAIVFGFFEQAESTFDEMEENIMSKDLPALSSLGHFLKGSSATLGLRKVQDACEKIQHFGVKKDESGTHDLPNEVECLDKIKVTLDKMKKDYKQAKECLVRFYDSP